MNELFAGYTNYSSTEAVLSERLTAANVEHPDTSLSLSVSVSYSASWTWTWSWTF